MRRRPHRAAGFSYERGQPAGGRGLIGLQSTVGNAVTSSVVQRRGPARTIDFADDEGLHINVTTEEVAGRGGSAGEREVEAEIDKLDRWTNLFLSGYRDGLNSFESTMKFASDQEARPRYFDVALKEVGKVLLDHLIDHATASMPIVGDVIKGAKDVGKALYDEAKRAEAAQGEARIREYIVHTRNALTEEGGMHRGLLAVMNGARAELLSDYRAAVRASSVGAPDEASREEFEQRQGSHGVLTGEAASFVRDLRSQVAAFEQRIPSAGQFQRMFTERFAGSRALTGPISQGGRTGGTLYLDMEIYRERHGSGDDAYWSYRVDSVDSHWTLATTAPEPARLAQSLADTTSSVLDTTLPKMVQVRVETEEWGLNDYERAYVWFSELSRPDYRGWNPELSRWVWSQSHIRRRALGVTAIEGSSD